MSSRSSGASRLPFATSRAPTNATSCTPSSIRPLLIWSVGRMSICPQRKLTQRLLPPINPKLVQADHPSALLYGRTCSEVRPNGFTARDLRKTYRRGGGVFSQDSNGARFTAVDGVSFSVFRSETFAVVRESGCGKTTLARMLLRLIEPHGGEVPVPGRALLTLPAQ